MMLLAAGKKRGERLPRHFQRDGLAHQLRLGVDAHQHALQLADVRFHALGDVFQHFRGRVDVLVGALFLQDGHARFEIRALYIHRQPPFKARTQPFLDGGDVLGRAV